jgi:hypothetical protein
MPVKAFLLTFITSAICLYASAQDKIIKKDGETIEANVSVINQQTVTFKRFDNPTGPEYSSPKGDVARIKYSNGTEDIFEDDNDRIGVKRKDMAKGGNNMHNDEAHLNKNIISFAPIAFTENGVGVGASIEHILDAKGVVNFYMPVYATFQRNSDTYTGTVNTYPMFYFMPGIKIYTNLNSSKKVKFSIGPSIVAGFGSGNLYNDNSISGIPTNATVSRFLLGATAIAGLNLFPTPHVYMGFEYGLGFCYMNNYGGTSQGYSALTQGSLKIGYRF